MFEYDNNKQIIGDRIMFALLTEILVFTFALSIDSFGASFAYGAGKIKIPSTSVLTMSGMCSIILLIALLAGQGFATLIPSSFAHNLSFILLLSIGLIKFFDSRIRHLINYGTFKQHNFQFNFLSLSFILTVYGDPEKANADQGQELSPRESISLAIALSLDSAAAGLGAGSVAAHPFITFLFSMFFGIIAITVGSHLGKKLTDRSCLDFTWLGGILLICLAFFERFA